MSHKSIRRVDRQKALIARLIVIASIFYGSFVAAELHLGDLKMLSAAGEPLRAEIPLGQAEISIENESIDVNLASDSMFERAGLTRDIFLASLELNLVVNSDVWTVKVTADEPLDRPYIDFLVQLDLPEGRKIREYRILRNPYLVVDQAPKQAFALNAVGKSTMLTQEAQPRVYKHRVVVGDTLWNVAKRLRPSHMTIAETMDHIYATNPEAFLDGDSTKLRKGFVVSFTLASQHQAEPVVEDLEASSSITQSSEQLIPIIDSQLETSPPSQVATELDDLEVQLEAQPLSELVEVAEQEISTIIEEQPVLEEQTELQQDAAQEVSEVDPLPTEVDTIQLSDQEKGLQPSQESALQVTAVAKPIDIARLKDFFNLESQQFNHWLTRLQKVPMDLWIIAIVFLLAALVNWRKKSAITVKHSQSLSTDAQQQPTTSDELADSVLDGPFAGSDDVFEKPDTNDQLQDPQGTEEPESEDYLADDFVDDNIDLDPLKVRLDMAALCIEMGDIENARAVLEEVISEADSEGKAEARAILDSIKA